MLEDPEGAAGCGAKPILTMLVVKVSGLVTCRVLLPPLRKGFSTKFPFPLPPAPGSELGAVAVESSGADVPGGAVPSCVGMVVCGKPQGALLVDGPSVNPFGPSDEVAAGVDIVVIRVTFVVDMTVVVLSVPETLGG